MSLQHTLNGSHSLTTNVTPRESAFTRRWGTAHRFARTADKVNQHSESSPRLHCNSALSEQILVSYKVGSASKKHSSFMDQLTDEAMGFLADQRGLQLQTVRKESAYNEAIVWLVDKLFDLLQAYSFQFNHRVGWNDFFVTCTKPQFVTEVLRYNKFREPIDTITHFRARLSTRFMSLVIRGYKTTIEFILLPVDKVIGLSQAETAYQPAHRLEASLNDGSVDWTIDGEPLTEERLELFAMGLFAILIDSTKKELQDNSYPV
ncbi:MAG: hypothetical protein HY711_05655 [Candidatus Melainabacteria bacterium]|nr:hypothetical protein [Candidatus Melainabacteria bacterium]